MSEPMFETRCDAWYWQRTDWWTPAGWMRCYARAKRYRDAEGSIVAVCGIHARSRSVQRQRPSQPWPRP